MSPRSPNRGRSRKTSASALAFASTCATHDLLVDALMASEPLLTGYLTGLLESADNAIEQLEALTAMPDGKME